MIRVGRCYYCGSFTKWTNCLLQAYVYRTHQANLCVWFPLTAIGLDTELSQGHARATPHHPELILNGFVTRLGHAVGRMFQTLYPPLPEFEGRQVVTLHNQRDFLFFRRHRYASISPLHCHVTSHTLRRYAFRSLEKAALQEIGPRFTLKLRWLKKGAPAVKDLGAQPPPLILASDIPEGEEAKAPAEICQPPKGDEYLWKWKVIIMFIFPTTFMFSFGCFCSPSWRFHGELFSCEARNRPPSVYVMCHERRLCDSILFEYPSACSAGFGIATGST